MTLYTPLGGLPFPQPTDTADLPLHLRSLAEGIDSRTVLRYPTAADRDAAITTPAAGMVAWLTTPGTLSYYTGSAWVAMGAWNAYTPAWTAETTNPAIGNGTLTGKYALVGKVCHFSALVTFGSTTAYGSGAYSLGLPVRAGALGGLPPFPGVAMSGGGRGVISCQPTAATNATTFTLWGPGSASSSKIEQLGSGGLFGSAWVSGSLIRVSGTYEVA
ncbi:hypothetical protein ACFS5L_36385 [Streptomyces phyllanthi]|uniref:Uncharacterized protein n=1 Tax=Streptomyces phyllanthi TaxID=1803180 RepID=A0A5N8WF45_9ACTN|nr:hypothetical protein [Streptomyces phyllanthi]MPY45869.1 hypothetical protein [Streptomyces phyllanthi]